METPPKPLGVDVGGTGHRDAQLGDLVLTDDGYYGIVSDPQNRYVFLGNGCEQYLEPGEWVKLQILPINTAGGTAPANFIEIIQEWSQWRTTQRRGPADR